jgi:hypothetical protein
MRRSATWPPSPRHGLDRATSTLSGAPEAAPVKRHDRAVARRLDERFFVPARARLGEPAWHDASTAEGLVRAPPHERRHMKSPRIPRQR